VLGGGSSRRSSTFVQAEADAGDPGFAKLAAWDVPSRTRERAALLRDQTRLLLDAID